MLIVCSTFEACSVTALDAMSGSHIPPDGWTRGSQFRIAFIAGALAMLPLAALLVAKPPSPVVSAWLSIPLCFLGLVGGSIAMAMSHPGGLREHSLLELSEEVMDSTTFATLFFGWMFVPFIALLLWGYGRMALTSSDAHCVPSD